MFRALLRLVVVVVILVGVGAFFFGWRWSGRIGAGDGPPKTVGTTGRVDTEKAKAVGAEVGAKTADVANRAAVVLSDGAVTAKIKSKMALDDTVKALDINIDTADGVVTLTGTVRSAAERTRAVQLARETAGVKSVVDRLSVR